MMSQARARLFAGIAAATALASAIPPAYGAGYFLSSRGSKTMARGGANIVGPQLLDALWLNPAALVDTPGLQVELDLYLGHQISSFERAQ